nr:unnamed protein product [Digitaria exilis]
MVYGAHYGAHITRVPWTHGGAHLWDPHHACPVGPTAGPLDCSGRSVVDPMTETMWVMWRDEVRTSHESRRLHRCTMSLPRVVELGDYSIRFLPVHFMVFRLKNP